MSFDFSFLYSQDNLIFFLIWLAILSVFAAVCFIIIRVIFRIIRALIKKIFKKKFEGHAMEGALTDKGEDISLQIEELEKSKRETAMAEAKEEQMRSEMKSPKISAFQYSHPIKSEQAKEKTGEEKEKEKEQEEIEAGLEKLKHPGEVAEKKSFLEQQAEARHGGEFMPKIKIPVSKKHRREDVFPAAGEEEPGQEKEFPTGGAKTEKQTEEAPVKAKQPAKIRQIQRGLQNFAGRIFGKKDKDKLEDEKKESTPFFEKPDIIKDNLSAGRKEKEKEKEQEEIEAGLEKLKHPGEVAEKKSFLQEQAGAFLGDVPIPAKPDVPVSEKDFFNKTADSQVQQGQPTGESPLARAQLQRESSKQIKGSRSEEQPPVFQAAKNKITQQPEKEDIALYEKPDFMENELGVSHGQKQAKSERGSALFGNKEEISRIELRRKLRRDADIWKAQKDVRLNLSPAERVKLEKDFFSKIYGRNISKRDIKTNLRRMGKDWASASNPKKKETLRRQIKFLKNISGIKDPYK